MKMIPEEVLATLTKLDNEHIEYLMSEEGYMYEDAVEECLYSSEYSGPWDMPGYNVYDFIR